MRVKLMTTALLAFSAGILIASEIPGGMGVLVLAVAVGYLAAALVLGVLWLASRITSRPDVVDGEVVDAGALVVWE